MVLCTELIYFGKQWRGYRGCFKGSKTLLTEEILPYHHVPPAELLAVVQCRKMSLVDVKYLYRDSVGEALILNNLTGYQLLG